MKALLPRSLMGQMVLAVALALLLVQAIGAALLYNARSERLETGMVNAAAFRIIGETRFPGERPRFQRRGQGRFAPAPHALPPERTRTSPIRAGETRQPDLEERLREILAGQGIFPQSVAVTWRSIHDDPVARAHPRPHRDGDRIAGGGRLLVAGVRESARSDWLVTRVRAPRGELELAGPLILQTVLIYLVVIGAVYLTLRRITRPLDRLTRRIERFAETRSADGQIDPEGPADIRRLIEAQNAMETRIAELLDEKDVMLGAIGHDLKTPLAALRVRIESVESEAQRERMAAVIEDITTTLDDILSLARVGRPSDLPERTELAALVASVVEEYEDMGDPVELGETRRTVLSVRPTWLRRALRNLIDNAIRYGGGAQVCLQRADGRAIITIDDNGPGIPEERIAAMMEPFARGDPSRNSETGGAGLGLALARAVADQHEGTLVLENRTTPDGTIAGLTARLTLPLI